MPPPIFGSQPRQQPLVIDGVEERLEVAIDGLTAALRPCLLHAPHRLMGVATGAKAMAMFAELAVILRSEHLRDGLLDHPIQHRRDA